MKHVKHYCHGGEETIDKIKRELTVDEYRGFCKGNMIKYKDRAPYKGNYDADMEKHDDYLAYLLEDMADRGSFDERDGFRYPPIKHGKSLREQHLKVGEEMEETLQAIRKYTVLNDYNSMMDALYESEDVIHAMEEFQRVMMRAFVPEAEESELNLMKRVCVRFVRTKNDKRGYYGEG